jgi:hypothetical protein
LPRKLIYAVALKSGKPVTLESLVTVAKVILYRTAKTLSANRVDVEVVNIPQVLDMRSTGPTVQLPLPEPGHAS